MVYDLVLSSGFLAFARQAGFLKGVEESGIKVGSLCGTSSGAMAGALWSSGRSAEEVLELLCANTPLWQLRPSLTPWRGLFSMAPVVQRLRTMLPERFEDMPMPFAVGVMDSDGSHKLLHSGELAPAIAASCAVPRLFSPVVIEGSSYQDGAFVDRVGVVPFRQMRGENPMLVHMVARSGGVAVDESALKDIPIVHRRLRH